MWLDVIEWMGWWLFWRLVLTRSLEWKPTSWDWLFAPGLGLLSKFMIHVVQWNYVPEYADIFMYTSLVLPYLLALGTVVLVDTRADQIAQYAIRLGLSERDARAEQCVDLFNPKRQLELVRELERTPGREARDATLNLALAEMKDFIALEKSRKRVLNSMNTQTWWSI